MPSGLLLDLYQLTMAQTYLAEGMDGMATFSLFARNLPPNRGYLVAAGLEDALTYLENFRFTGEDLDFLDSTNLFTAPLLERFDQLKFTGRVRALAEGTVCFADEPLLEVTAPILEAQLVETMLINEIQLQTLIATKAARCVDAGAGRRLVDFALRRAHGGEAGMKVARASFIGGFEATSNVRASQTYGIPAAGTMAHSFIEAFPDELSAFRAYARAYPDRAVLLVDTYDSIEGARNAGIVGRELAANGHQLAGIRLDSGDFADLSRKVRMLLDEAGLSATTVFASGGLDEYEIADLVAGGAPIDGFGVGTRMGVSADAPHLDLAYKLVSYDGTPTMKLSEGKATWPGAKQVWRHRTNGDAVRSIEDWIGLADESAPEGAVPLLAEVMKNGERTSPVEPLAALQSRRKEEIAALPEACRRMRAPVPPVLRPTPALWELRREIAAKLRPVVEAHR
ncbi:MAG: nicotinate phosphoribosyltransferase [Candidatus Handelsmanbacteria bacterium RIFCSPLOWO2_12_FULL_64_10]|uniref:Nicotinate phosphoribosyltransferase n=1 Tax=Handelsmanbacteria sp. (strain RIFCSPLOWO2_12_FULL_64_10) TaxID=1817868 RepID=A0A1F6C703_HANXR|nr:MAG: nicotinate phosphoribosyltransferase [Candidatus Handelsmanbacteria bacterium RIFCSPLOWO2_12_FULL_64_10]